MSLKISDLNIFAGKKQILFGVDLEIKPNSVHVLMGPNGSGKTSLVLGVMGHPDYSIKSGQIILDKKIINNLTPEEKAKLGLFLSFQKPQTISGVCYLNFLRNLYLKFNKDKSKSSISDFLKILKIQAEIFKVKEDLLKRGINENFSGGEQKKMEILTMAILKPKYLILDEIDTGLDIDALKTIASGINHFKKNSGILIITHYQRILKFIKPDFVHIMIGGKIVKSGNYKLASEIENTGFKKYQ